MSDALSEFLGLEEITPMQTTYSGPMQASGLSAPKARQMKQYQANYDQLFGEYKDDEFIFQYGNRGNTSNQFNTFANQFLSDIQSGFNTVVVGNQPVQDAIDALKQSPRADRQARAARLQSYVDQGFLDAGAWLSDFEHLNLQAVQNLARQGRTASNLTGGKRGTNYLHNSTALRDSWEAEQRQQYDTALAIENDRLRNDYEATREIWQPMYDTTSALLQTDFTDASWNPKIAEFNEILKDRPAAEALYGSDLVNVMEQLALQYTQYQTEIEQIQTANEAAALAASTRQGTRDRLLSATQDAHNTSQNALNTYLEGQGIISQAQNAAANTGFGRSRTAQLQASQGAAAGLEAATQSGVAIKEQEAQTRMFDVLATMLPEEQDNVLSSIGIELGEDIEANRLAVSSLLQNVEDAIREANLTAGAEGDRVSARLGEIKNILAREQLSREEAIQSVMFLFGLAASVTSLAAGALK